MALSRLSTSSLSRYYSDNSTIPATGYPLVAACWACPTSISSTRSVFSFADYAGGTDMFYAGLTTGPAWFINATVGSSATSSGGIPILNAWAFVLARWISATNRWLEVIQSDGTIVSVQNTTSRVPTTLSRLEIGARGFSVPSGVWIGHLAEFWYSKSVLFGITGAMPVHLLRQLAYYGPFSIPSLRDSIVDYQPLRVGPNGIGAHRPGIIKPTWVNESDGSLPLRTGPNPPLPANPLNARLFKPF